MPEAAVDENHLATWAKHEVRLPRQGPVMDAVAIAHTVNQAADS